MVADAGDPMPLALHKPAPPPPPPPPAAAAEDDDDDLPRQLGWPVSGLGAADEGDKETSPPENPNFNGSSDFLLPAPADDGAEDIKSLKTMSIYASDYGRGSSSPAYARQHDRDCQTDIDDSCMDLGEERDDDRPLLCDRYWGNGFPSYLDNPLYFANEYLDRNGHRSYTHHHYPFQKFHRDPINQYNPMDALDTGHGYLDTVCCSTKPCFEKNYYPVGASLSNPQKWTCFLNCILQCVVHTVPLVLKLLEDDHIDPCPRDSDGFCCYCSLKLHAREVIRLSGDVLYPKKFVKLLELILPDFEWGRHQDAHEFLRCLLEKLDKASVAPRAPSERPSSIVKEIFGGQLRSQLHCPECNHCSDRLEPFLDLSLEVIEMNTVTEALESFTKVEVFEDFSCDECKSRVNMEKQLKVEQAPEVLVIQLKRFQNVGSDISKIQAMVEYQLELDLNPFVSSADQEPQKYDLYGVVEHLGVSSKGHYVCYIRSSQIDWFLFDDDRVMKCSEGRVLDNKAYLLFYIKQGSSPWFSNLLKLCQKNMLLPDSSKEFAEKGSNKIDFFSEGKDDSTGHCFIGTTGKNETGPSFGGDLSRLQGNADGGTLHVVRDKNEASCSLGGVLSGGIQKVTCLPGSSADNGYDGSRTVLLENKENVSPQGSHNMHETSQFTEAPSQEGSLQKDGSICSSLQSSHEHENGCSGENSSSSNQMSFSAGPVLRACRRNGISRLCKVGFNSDHESAHLDSSISNDDGDESTRKPVGGTMKKKKKKKVTDLKMFLWMKKRAEWHRKKRGQGRKKRAALVAKRKSKKRQKKVEGGSIIRT